MAHPPGAGPGNGSYPDTPQKQKAFRNQKKETSQCHEANAHLYPKQLKQRRSPTSAIKAPK